MKTIITSLLAALGLTCACGQEHYENKDVQGFSALMGRPGVVLLDVRTPDEFREGHIEHAVNIDVTAADFLTKATATLPKSDTIAVYCRSGKRSARASALLSAERYTVVNLLGGIMAWSQAGRPVTTNTHEVDTFTTPSGKTLRFHALMHASIRIEYDGREIEIDPVSALGNRTVDYSAMPAADYIFVTHEHPDHFSPETIRLLTGEGTQLVTNRRCCDLLGFGTAMANGDRRQLADGLSVEAVPAYNTTEGRQQFHPKGRDNGLILTFDGLRVYLAGDTEDIPEMASMGNIDIAFLPCNQPFTMTPEQLVRAALMVRPKVLFPYHYGDTDVSGLPERLQSEGIDVRIRHYE